MKVKMVVDAMAWRNISLTHCAQLSARILANTCVESVRCLPRALSHPRSLKSVSIVSNSTCSLFPATNRARNSDRTVWSKPGSEFQTQGVLEVDPATHRIGG